MNILIVGNGFDLAHGLPTKYGDFLGMIQRFKSIINEPNIMKAGYLDNIEKPIIYIMTCRIGPFFNGYAKKIKKLGGKIYLNPDGHEWMRAKWSKLVRTYWKYSEKKMVLGSDLIVCDSKNIEK